CLLRRPPRLRSSFSLYCSAAPRDLPSFPTRRSSDLPVHPRLLQGPAVPGRRFGDPRHAPRAGHAADGRPGEAAAHHLRRDDDRRSEEHTSELQSRENLVCRLLLEKKKEKEITNRE